MRSLPGLRLDRVQIHSDASSSDSEGNITTSLTLVYDGRGTFTEGEGISAQNFTPEIAAGRPVGSSSAYLELRTSATISEGMRATLRGVVWSIVSVEKLRTHTVCKLVSPVRESF